MDKKNVLGFTLIELVVVIVIVGIMAVIAVPKFIDFTSKAQQAALDGIGGAISSSSAINYAAKLASLPYETVSECNRATLASLIDGHTLTEYTVSGDTIVDGASAACTIQLTDDLNVTGTYPVIGAS